jgi:hypothetical protein
MICPSASEPLMLYVPAAVMVAWLPFTVTPLLSALIESPFNTICVAFVASTGVLTVLLCGAAFRVGVAATAPLCVAATVGVLLADVVAVESVFVAAGMAVFLIAVGTVAGVLTAVMALAVVVTPGETCLFTVETAAGFFPHALSMVSAKAQTNEITIFRLSTFDSCDRLRTTRTVASP